MLLFPVSTATYPECRAPPPLLNKVRKTQIKDSLCSLELETLSFQLVMKIEKDAVKNLRVSPSFCLTLLK